MFSMIPDCSFFLDCFSSVHKIHVIVIFDSLLFLESLYRFYLAQCLPGNLFLCFEG